MLDPRLVVLIPAHNEADRIGAAIEGLWRQTRKPDLIVVVTDNCTDDTAEVAASHGAEVFATRGNTHKKAGALNQAIDWVLPHLDERDLLLVQDADTVLNPWFSETATATFNRKVGAVGGVFYGEQGGGLLGLLQRMEFQRYAWELDRTGGKAQVLTGTGTMFRARVLHEVQGARRSGLIGGGTGYYSLASLTEDDEMTKAVKTLGYRAMSPAGCAVTTEVMTSLPKLWHQRLRWQRGALENLGEYGVLPQTFRYWAQQLGIGYGVLALSSYLVLIFVMAFALDSWVWFPFWLGLGVVFSIERVISVWKGGWRARLLSAALFPELFYAMFLNVVYVKGVLDISVGSQARWKHVVQSPTDRTGRQHVKVSE